MLHRPPLLALLIAGCGGFHPITEDAGTDAGETSPFTLYDDSPDGGSLRAVWGSSATDVYAVGDDGVILHLLGDTLYRINVGAGVDLTSVWGANADEVWVVGSYRDTKKGVLFKREPNRFVQFGVTPFALKSVFGIDELRWAVGVEGAIYEGDTNAPFAKGTQVQPNQNIPPTPLAPIHWGVGGTSRDNVYVAADIDTFHRWDGAMWHTYEDPQVRTRGYRSVWGPPGGATLFLGGNYFAVWQVDGPMTLTALNEERDTSDKFDRWIWGIWGPSADQIVVVGDEGRIMTWDSASQKMVTRISPTTRNLYGIWGTSLDDLWIVGERGLVLRGKLSP